ncbi:MAG: glycosyltransferase [Lachnospiraceae bacterium]|nr:glycosyltransferase [Lachnospiraceae bacterium]
MEKTRPVLSISMLVSNNRRDTIEKCMESLVPLMNAVPSELIIVDTGCTDGSVDIARKYADKVVRFTWCKDFSAARNAGLFECTGEWFLYLDDDEWFEDVSELIAFFRGEERKHYDTLWYIQRNYNDFEGTAYSDSYVGRCVKRTSQTKFCGKIHEWLEPLPQRIKQVDSFVHHYGYVFKTEEDRKKHLERNLSLEEAAVKENPEDIRMCCQLVQEYRSAKRFEDAERFAKETLQRTKYEKTNSFVQYLLITLPKIYMEAEEIEKALAEYERLLREEILLHQSKLAIYCERAFLYGRENREKEAAEESLRYLEEYGVVPGKDEPQEFPIMDFEQYRSKFNRQRVIKSGITGAMLSKEYGYLGRLFAGLDWVHDTEISKEMVKALVQCYLFSKDESLLLRELGRVLKEEALRMPVYAILHSAYVEFSERRPELAAVLEKLNRRDGNFGFFHLLYTEGKGITTEADITDYYEKSDRKYDVEVAELFLEGCERKLSGFGTFENGMTVEATVKEYILWANRYEAALFGDGKQVKEEGRECPPAIQLARMLEEVLPEPDLAVCGEKLKQVVAMYPVMLPVAKALLAEKEVAILAGQLKTMARNLLIEGKTEEAKAVLSELAVLVPGDAEVKELLTGN